MNTNNVASERVRMHMTQKELAKEVEVSESTVLRWEKGEALPTGMQLIRLNRLFGCSTDYLLGLTNERRAA